MSAETLRKAAALMRERARCGDPLEYPVPWAVEVVTADGFEDAGRVVCDDGAGDVTDALDMTCAHHIASWHPAVALAVADWLDREAGLMVEMDALVLRASKAGLVANVEGSSFPEALAVARAYLGSDDGC